MPRVRREGSTPQDQQRAATGTGTHLRRSRRPAAAAPRSSPRQLRRFTQFAAPRIGRLFHPGPTVLLLMGFTVALAILVLLVLMSAGRRTDPRVAACTDRLHRVRAGN